MYRWSVEAIKIPPAPEISDDIQEMQCDEMWHFVGAKKTHIRPLRKLDFEKNLELL
jgi:hypothetical protein